MFGWLKRKSRAVLAKPGDKAETEAPMAVTATAAQTTAPAIASVQGYMASVEPGAAAISKVAIDAVPAPASKGRARRMSAKATKRAAPVVGMMAMAVSGRTSNPVSVVAVQANGRRVFVKAKGDVRVRAFTLRADRSFRLDGAPDRSEPRLLIGS